MEANATDTPDHSRRVSSTASINKINNVQVEDCSAKRTRKASDSPSKVSHAASLASSPKRMFRGPSLSGRAVRSNYPVRRMVRGTARVVATVLRAADPASATGVNVVPPLINRSVPRKELFAETPQGTAYAPSIADTIDVTMLGDAPLDVTPPENLSARVQPQPKKKKKKTQQPFVLPRSDFISSIRKFKIPDKNSYNEKKKNDDIRAIRKNLLCNFDHDVLSVEAG